MFSRIFSKGFFRQGFPGWYRGRFSEVIPSNPGKFTLAVSVAGATLSGSVAQMALDSLTPQFVLDELTAGFDLESLTPTFALERQF